MKHPVQKLLLLGLLLFSTGRLFAQTTYGNEWIDYSKTYFKFKVGSDGTFRIQRSTLDVAGIPSTIKGSNLILYRDGVEVPIYASADVMTSSDYIEFWGKRADGSFDKQLYVTPTAQPDDRISLFTDTACYYLTWDANTNHARYVDATIPIPGTTPAPQAYCLATVGNYYRSAFCGGATYDDVYIFNSTAFDQAEGFVENMYQIYNGITLGISTPNLVASAPVSAKLNTSVVTQSLSNSHEVTVKLNNQLVADSAFGASETKHYSVNVSPGLLSANNTIDYANIANPGAGTINRYGVSYIEIVYPRNFDVNGLSAFTFKLPGTGTAQYLEFLNYSGSQPRLYDKTNNVWYNGDVSISGKVRFYLSGSIATRELLLTSASATAQLPVSKKINFIDYTASAQQGDYVIVTHNSLRQSTSGTDYIKEYQDYRSSTAGGGFTAVVADVTDLYDQFAYGYDIHPLSVRRYLQYAYDKWTIKKPAYVNMVGRGILYAHYPAYHASPSTYTFPIVPTYGDPGTDVGFVNFGNDKLQKIIIGRVSVWNGGEVGIYLNKVKAYEQALQPALQPGIASEMWKKQVIHIVSSSDDTTQQGHLISSLAGAGTIIADTLSGYQIFSYNNTSNLAVNPVNNIFVDSLINNGINLLTYYGHASSGGFQYALNNPEQYHNVSKLPFLLAMGCDVAQMFALSTSKTITERYLLHPGGGAISVLAADNLGYPDFLDDYLYETYQNIAYKAYGAPIGKQVQNIYNNLLLASNTPKRLIQLESQIYAGDPAVHMYSNTKPDFHIPSEEISAIPANVTISSDSFKLKIVAYNLAKAVYDTVTVKVEHKAPNGIITTVRTYRIPNLYNTNVSYIWVPVNKLTDLGINRYIVTIDPDNRFDEVSKTNNVGTFDLFIYSDNLVPVYPKEFAIVNKQGVTLKASTLKPFKPIARYKIEIDTTMLFNSPQLLQTTVVSAGGVIKWTPNLVMHDSTVYYWRAACDTVINGSIEWTSSSFIYLAQGSPGWNQSHYYQYQQDSYDNMSLTSGRRFDYHLTNNSLQVYNNICYQDADQGRTIIYWNGNIVQRGPTDYTAIHISVIDSVSGKWWLNSANDTRGANPPAQTFRGTWVREFNTTSATGRLAAAAYLESIPAGNYVIIKNVLCRYDLGPTMNFAATSPPIYINDWKADTALNGNAGKSLYKSIKALGFDKIDSFYTQRVFLFARKVGVSPTVFPITQLLSSTGNTHDTLKYDALIPGWDKHGAVNSTVIGPVKKWEALKWKQHSLDAVTANDSATVTIFGIDSNNVETYLYNNASKDTALTFISAKTYPSIRMVWGSGDSITNTPPQLDYWRVLYSPVPEAALNPAAHFALADSLHIGQQGNFSVAIENLTEIPMDSMLVTYKIIDAGGSSHLLANKRYRPLPGDDTLHASLAFDPAAYPGKVAFFVEANPNNDQPEQYHPNNLGYIPFKVITDKSNPLLDVTFDGQHILDGDIVSPKPFIKVLLKDENRYLPIDDTSMVTLSLRYPDDPLSSSQVIPFDGTICKFIPASIGADGKNEATIEFRPTHLDDGKYELFVTGKDRSGNTSGLPQGTNAIARYQTSFEVVNKSTVSNVLNYPNPFSTSTAFVFTLTGSEIPSQFKIQIMTVTGRVVKEITKQELGPIHIGRNITEYKWDGRDQYGQVLGNGVYMYRVATSLNGNDVEHRNSGADVYFKAGWGKMYIMR